MKLLIDDASPQEIRRLYDLYPIDGVTTNPSILARAGQDPLKVLQDIRSLIGSEALLFAQAIPTDSLGMIEDAKAITDCLGTGTIVKIPVIPEGLKAIRLLNRMGISTCGTVVYSPMQALLAAKAGASYVAPYVNRIDNLGYDGIRVVEQIQDILENHGLHTQVLAASFKNSQQVLELARYGVACATCAPAVIDALLSNACVDAAVSDFVRDFEKTGYHTMKEALQKKEKTVLSV